ncbi:hypothetical protein [Pedobacter sp. NJ-S-72]
MKTHFITYGDDKYRDQRKLLKQTALNSAFFDEVKVFSPSSIESNPFLPNASNLFLNKAKEEGTGYGNPTLSKKHWMTFPMTIYLYMLMQDV